LPASSRVVSRSAQGERQALPLLAEPPAQEGTVGLPWSRIDFAVVAAAALATLVAMIRLWTAGVPSPIDFIPGVYRAFELAASIEEGLFYPRLGMGLNFTYGAPLFEFYAPLASYFTVFLHWAGLGFVEAQKGVFTLALFVGAVGAYVYARWLYGGRLPAAVTCGAWLFAPYYLSNAYERGAIAESVALAFVPWLFFSFHHLLDCGKRIWILPSSVSLACLILSHNIPALFATALLAAYVTLVAIQGQTWRRLPLVAIAGALGLVVSSFYWLPALADRSYTVVDSTLTMGELSVGANLAPVSELVQTLLAFDYWGTLRFRLGLWPALVGLAAILALPLQPKATRRFLLPLAGAAVLMLLLQSQGSQWFWDTAPLVRYIQFPWRLAGLVSFAVAIMAGSLVQVRWLPVRGRQWGAALLLVLMSLASLWNLSPDRSSIWYMFTSEEVSTPDAYYRGRLGFPVYADFMPIWTAEESKRLSLPRPAGSPVVPALSGVPGVPGVEVLEETLSGVKLRVRASEPFTLRLHKLYYPGWQAFADGRSIMVKPTSPLGLVSVELPSGDYPVSISFGETPLRAAADVISLLTLAAGVGAAVWILGGRKALVACGGLIALLAGLMFWGPSASEPVRRPSSYSANLQDEIRLVGYDAGRTEVRRGETLRIRLYWFVQSMPSDDYKVLLHLIKPGNPAQVAQADGEPLLGYSPTTRWEPGELIADDHDFALPKDLPPGEYQLLVGLYRASTMRNLTVRGAREVLPGDRIVLTSLRVTNE
jgi:hypothetical protein